MKTKNVPDGLANVSRRLMPIEEAMLYIGLGKSSARKYLDSIGAKIKIGRRTLYDKNVIDGVLSTLKKQDDGEEDINVGSERQ
jgi:hypothetical protein